MKALLFMSEAQKKKIQTYIKNRIDISDLIKDYDIKEQDLSNAIIRKLNRPNQDIRNTKFVNTIFGGGTEIINFSGCDMTGCNFKRARFESMVWFKHTNLTASNFHHTYIPFVEFRYADFTNASLCGITSTFGSKCWYGAKLDTKYMMDLWAKYLNEPPTND